MFAAGRIIAIDDERAYLDQLSRNLHGMGIPCIPICYPDEVPEDDVEWLRGVRILFCDLHLLTGVKPTLNYPVIGGLLERMTSKLGSPVLLILWTDWAQDAEELEKYLAERHAEARPVAVLALRKSDFQGGLEKNLPAAIREKLGAIPQLRALYEWQDDVAAAGNACIGELLRLARKQGENLKESLDKLLTALAQAATGKDLAAEDPGSALQEVLVPLVADKLSHLPDDETRIERWKQVLPSAIAKVDSRVAGEAAINTALNVAHISSGAVTGRERGAVIKIECPSLFLYRFAGSQDEILSQFFIKDLEEHRWVAVQVEAACDYAQRKSPCLPFVLALEVPAKSKFNSKYGKTPAIWRSPSFLSETEKEVCLVANVRYTTTVSWRKAKTRQAIYRLRDSLVSELAFCKAQHELRPGSVKL